MEDIYEGGLFSEHVEAVRASVEEEREQEECTESEARGFVELTLLSIVAEGVTRIASTLEDMAERDRNG